MSAKGYPDYALQSFKRVNQICPFSVDELKSFFKDSQQEILEIYYCDHLRHCFGRALELYILFDRALYLY